MLRLGWFSTGRGPGSRNLLREVMDKKKDGSLDIEFSFVFCNWDNTEEPNPRREQREQFFRMVKDYDIPLITISWKTFRPDLWDSDQEEWRNEYGKEIRKQIKDTCHLSLTAVLTQTLHTGENQSGLRSCPGGP